MTAPDPTSQFTGNIKVPFERIAAFIRQVTHDVRNSLNAMDLQAAYILEIASDPEATEEISRMRAQITQSARSLQSLSANFWLPQPSMIPYQASIFMEDFRDRLAKVVPEKISRVEWTWKLSEENISVDLEMLFTALAELFKNAFHFGDPAGAIHATASADGGRFSLEITESLKELPTLAGKPVVALEHWGEEPFVSTRRGGYGLGLFRTRMVLAAHRGDLRFTFDSGRALLATRVTLPLVT
jgi:signal transduction histidine kinase